MKPRIVFMGTPDFAIPSLEILLANGYPVIAVVSQPDRPKGRGRKLIPPSLKVVAEKHGIPVLQPESVRDLGFIEQFKQLSPDMIALAAFGQIIPKDILDIPPLGCLNVHPSLLPQYRGAAPINWSLINGDTTTGVTIMLMDEGMDTGDILLQEETEIDPDEVYDSLHDRLSLSGAQLLLAATDMIVAGKSTPLPQDSSKATYAPRLTKDMEHINWESGADSLVNLIRGLSSDPGAYAFLREKKLKIYRAVAGKAGTSGEKAPGTIGKLMESGLQITAQDGHIYLQEVQLEGKKRMPVDVFLRGFRLSADDRLE
jgi:methionyl-tRNA formyltransferase